MAADAPPLVTLINLDHPSLAVAGDMPSRIAALARETGEPEPTDVGPQIRCCLESLAMTYRHVLARLEEVLDRKFDVLHIVGGGGRNRLLSQMAADATNRRVVVGPLEATAVGNLLVQAMASGDVADLAHIRRIARASFEPETYLPKNAKAWDDAYGRFASLLKQ
jgi:rhamnulokinase